jgi:poly [ADP-ribose] polymerase
LGFFACGDQLPGFGNLEKEDRDLVKKNIPAIKSEEIAAKKLKTEPKDEVDAAENAKLEETIKKQTKAFYDYKDNLKSNFTKQQLINILFLNNSFIPEGIENILERCSDFFTFGALAKCPKCHTGDFVFKKNGYGCEGKRSFGFFQISI